MPDEQICRCSHCDLEITDDNQIQQCADCGDMRCFSCINVVSRTRNYHVLCCDDCAAEHWCDICEQYADIQLPICEGCNRRYCSSCAAECECHCESCRRSEESADTNYYVPSEIELTEDNAYIPPNFTSPLLFPDGVRAGVEFELEYGTARRFTELMDAGWSYKRDGSLNDTGCEFITPPSYGRGTLGRIYNCYCLLRNNGWRTSERTGLHVHFSFRERPWNTRRLVRMAALWNSWMQMLYLMQTRNRIASGYCNANLVSLHQYRIHRTRVSQGRGTSAVDHTAARSLFGSDRYYGLNVACALAAHGTIEFRLAEGMDSPDDAVRWIALLAWLVKAADSDPDMSWVRSAYDQDATWGEADIQRRFISAVDALNIPDRTTHQSLITYGSNKLMTGASVRGLNSARLYNTAFMLKPALLRKYLRDPNTTVATMIWLQTIQPAVMRDVMSLSGSPEETIESFVTGYIRGIQRYAQYEPTPNGNNPDPEMCEILLRNKKKLVPYLQAQDDYPEERNEYARAWERYHRANRTSDRFGIPAHNPMGFRMEVPCAE